MRIVRQLASGAPVRGAALIGLVASLACAATAGTPAPKRVKSSKRGVCANHLSRADAVALSAGVSWFYTWQLEATEIYYGVDLDFYPMVWSTSYTLIEQFQKRVAAGGAPDYVLILNEPNLKGQAYATPAQSAEAVAAIRKIAEPAGVRVVGPHMAVHSNKDSSVTAYDPLQDQEVTYTQMVPYLTAFYHHLGEGDTSTPLGVHSYGDINELRQLLEMLEETYPGRQIWITEFAWWGAPDEASLIEYMTQAVKLFEENPSVAKYAWFKARTPTEDQRMSLLSGRPGELTRLGRTYVDLPVHLAAPTPLAH